MAHARIVQRSKSAMQSGKSRVGAWTVEFAPDRAQAPDPLTGWAGGQETQTQVGGFSFAREADAIAWCERNGHSFSVVPSPPASLKLQAYADNFR